LRRANKSFWCVRWTALAALPALLCTAGDVLPQAKQPSKTHAAEPAPVAELAVPFRAGETLDYRAGWQLYTGGATLKLAAVERRDFFGRASWHFQAQATTLNPLRYLFVLDDQFDSYSAASDLACLQYEMYLREQNKIEDHVRRIRHEGEPVASDGPTVRLPVGTRDPLGALYFLRTVDWRRTPSMKLQVYEGKKVYEVRARLAEESKEVEVPAGTFRASRIDFRVFERGKELTNVRISIWFARDAARTPVLIEAQLPFGAVRAELNRP